VPDIVGKFLKFGFTKTEAQVYITLLKNGRCSGYKIAKDISLSRSTVYSSIDSLYSSGHIFMCEGNTKEYEAKSPNLILSQIEKSTIEDISMLKRELTKIAFQEDKQFVYNVSGYENLVQKAREIIDQASLEIYLNTDFDLNIFSSEICNAIERDVRVIGFSFNKIKTPHPKVELYSRSQVEETDYPSHRFMLVSDMQLGLIFSHREDTVGIYTNNKLMLKITAEHIHSDIYLSKYESLDPDQKFKVNTLHERTNEMVEDSMKRSTD
jgi:sugar-specific transcriptional regulator TrmB